ncbi:MAG: hypothetical protein HUU55_10035 [Myxococcales bacterium]|nr:hypothetical protein [Myxococcales bacterium]
MTHIIWRKTTFLTSVLFVLNVSSGCGESSEKSQTTDVSEPVPDLGTDSGPESAGDTQDTLEHADMVAELPLLWEMTVYVTLDGRPVAGALVMQGGRVQRWETDTLGIATVTLDLSTPGDLGIVAAHPNARSQAETFVLELGLPNEVTISLTSFDELDNESYVFGDPGRPDENSSSQCRHCHETVTFSWFDSPHRTSASNPKVHDLYSGTAASVNTQQDCEKKGGHWDLGIEPGTGKEINRCYVGAGLLPYANVGCQDGPCDTPPDQFGACADCHAPGINGKLGGRDLHEATGIAYEYGVHCDVCHHVESVDLAQDAPGVAGRLKIHRPTERASSPALGDFLPLTFGPNPDVPVVKMGGVARNHFRDSTLCAGCHELEHEGFLPGDKPDVSRWPTGKIPIQTTFSEWEQGPFHPGAPCQSCHMEPAPLAQNGADVQNLAIGPGLISGWERPPGTVRQHSFAGPRQPKTNMLQLAAAVFIEKTVEAGAVTGKITVKNVGAGHAIPTGEPMRSMIVVVQAFCGTTELTAIGGDAISDVGGYLDRRQVDQGFDTWPNAQVGDVIRVVQTTGEYHDYPGFGPFGDGTFTPAQKGLAKEWVAGQVTVTAVEGDTVTFSGPLPEGTVAYRSRPPAVDSPVPPGWAGAAGFVFARLLADAAGKRQVPHFVAKDVLSDNRLLPQQQWTSTHIFAAGCGDPTIRATLYYRPYPLGLAMERSWSFQDTIMAEAQR